MSVHAVTAVIADDEAPLRTYLKRQLGKLWPQLNIAAEAVNGNEALQLIRDHKTDIAFLDIQMPGMNGLEVANLISDQCHIVFITAYNQYAIEAFEKAAVDYLMKPVNNERLRTTIARLQSRLAQSPRDISQLLTQLSEFVRPTVNTLQWLKVAQQDEIRLLSVDDVDYFRAGDKYTSVYSGGKEWIIRTPLKELESSLDPDQFWRIHRSTIVRVEAIARVTRDLAGRYWLEVHGYQQPLQVSRSYVQLFKQN